MPACTRAGRAACRHGRCACECSRRRLSRVEAAVDGCCGCNQPGERRVKAYLGMRRRGRGERMCGHCSHARLGRVCCIAALVRWLVTVVHGDKKDNGSRIMNDHAERQKSRAHQQSICWSRGLHNSCVSLETGWGKARVHRQAHIQTHTVTHRHTQTQTQRHRQTQTDRHTHTHTDTRTHAQKRKGLCL